MEIGFHNKEVRPESALLSSAILDFVEKRLHKFLHPALVSDPYLETREKEDAFLRRVTEAIEQGLRFAPVGVFPFTPPAAVEAPSVEDDENISAALDFADSF